MDKLKFRLKGKILLLLTVSLTLTLGLYVTTAINLYREDKDAYIYEATLSRIDQIKSQLSYIVRDGIKDATTLAQYSEIDDISVNRKIQEFDNIRFLVAYDPSTKQRRIFGKEDEVKKLDESIFSNIENNKIVFKHILEGPADTFQKPHSIISTYVKSIRKVITFSLDMSKFINQLKSDSLYQVFILNKADGKVILNKEIYPFGKNISFPTAPNNSTQSSITTGIGGRYLTTISSNELLGLKIITAIPEERAYRANNELVRKSLFFAAFILSLMFAVSIFFSTSITDPLNLLIEGTKRVGSGNFNHKVIIKTKDEISLLAKSFNQMQDKILKLIEEAKEKSRLESEIKVAQTVQSTLFPVPDLKTEQFHLSGFYQSATECGGDWWSFKRKGNQLFITIADATGHGVGPALITSALASSSYILFNDEKLPPPKTYLETMNKVTKEISQGQIHVTCFAAIIDFNSRTIQFANAGHNFPYLIRNGEKLRLSQKAMTRLGQEEETIYQEESMVFLPGDYLFLFTDGVSDRESNKNIQLGEKRMIKKLQKLISKDLNPNQVRDQLSHEIIYYSEKPIDDDLTFVVINLF
jgi:sigma-B regulation protein RsbU (phosphoserine phosphatase)